MNMDWQTIFYVITSLTMVSLLIFLIGVVMIVRKIYKTVDMGVRNVSSVGTIAKISLLRTILKFIR